MIQDQIAAASPYAQVDPTPTGARGGPYHSPVIFWQCDLARRNDQKHHALSEVNKVMHFICRALDELERIEPDLERPIQCECSCHSQPRPRGRPRKT